MAEYSVNTIADLLLLDPRRIQQMAKEGILPKSDRGKYDLVACVQGYVRYLREQAKGKDPEKLAEEKKIVKENRLLKELARKQKEGLLVDAEELRRELAKAFTDVKTRIRSIAPKSAQAIAHLKMEKKVERELITSIQAILQKDHDEALEELSKWKP